jgi:hypothetical protein
MSKQFAFCFALATIISTSNVALYTTISNRYGVPLWLLLGPMISTSYSAAIVALSLQDFKRGRKELSENRVEKGERFMDAVDGEGTTLLELEIK